VHSYFKNEFSIYNKNYMVQFVQDDFDASTSWKDMYVYNEMPIDMQKLKNNINVYRKELVGVNMKKNCFKVV
jgi:hypothetical protein